MPSTVFSEILQFTSVLAAAAAAALWLKGSMIHGVPLRIGEAHRQGQNVVLITSKSDPILLDELETKLSRLSETYRHQVRWTAIGARFAALAMFLQLLKAWV